MILRLLLLFLMSVIATVESIKCYKCDSISPDKNPYQCNEFFDDSELEPESCDEVHNAQYCIKQIGIFEGGLRTRRSCSSSYLGNYCNYLQHPGGTAYYRSCYFTCQGDGCNSAVNTRTPLLSMATLTCLLLIYVIR